MDGNYHDFNLVVKLFDFFFVYANQKLLEYIKMLYCTVQQILFQFLFCRRGSVIFHCWELIVPSTQRRLVCTNTRESSS